MITTTLIVPGLNGSGPGHWQSWMQQRILNARRVEQDDWEAPVLARWAGAVRREIDRAPGVVILIAHSFGALAAIVAAVGRRERIAGALLVAPADPDRFTASGLRRPQDEHMDAGLGPELPATHLGFPSIVVASADDPWLRLTRAGWWADRWGSRFLCLGNAGHINIDSGYGPWHEGLQLYDALRRVPTGGFVGEIGGDAGGNAELPPRRALPARSWRQKRRQKRRLLLHTGRAG
jgi:predicted alpha/beta hydrolase family esterase